MVRCQRIIDLVRRRAAEQAEQRACTFLEGEREQVR